MTLQTGLAPTRRASRASVFAGLDVCAAAGLRTIAGSARVVFEQDVWTLPLADAHRMVSPRELRWDFTVIANAAWRMVAKEILAALLAPQLEAVLHLPHALRSERSPRTCFRLLERWEEWFGWLTGRGITSLEQVDQELCDRYLEDRRWSVPDQQGQRRELEPETLAEPIKAVQLIALYGELLSADRYRDGFAPWPGKTAAQVVGRKPSYENSTQPVPDVVLQPLLATCLFLVDVVGPHVAALLSKERADPAYSAALEASAGMECVPALHRKVDELLARGEPLPALSRFQVAAQRRKRKDAVDPLRNLAWSRLARLVGAKLLDRDVCDVMRPRMIEAAAAVGIAPALARDATLIARLEDGAPIAFVDGLCHDELATMAHHIGTACLLLTSALSGMRASELMELEVGGRMPPREITGGGRRFRVAGRLIKRKRFGGVPDQWVVIEEVDRALALAEQITGAADGQALFRRIDVSGRLKNLRRWLEKTGYRERWGLPVIPEYLVSARSLRRTLAVAIASRPGGLLATKIHLKHISVATTEGYAARPGGSQRLFQAEVEQAEQEHHLRLTVEAFRDFQRGINPAGPGARELIETFTGIDAALKDAERTEAKVLADERHLENLLRKQANALHVGAANYCWFRDPAKALCLRLAGTPDAKRPLAGMCDSARCPQATHHPCHRPVWAAQAESVVVFLDNPRIPKGEKARLAPERDRSLRVLAAIDAAGERPVVEV